jgi:2,3-dihydroxy-p-cumate/2,3-dihydroxybenzoate 3,4-dioxygenase
MEGQMIHLKDLRYVRLGTRDLAQATEYAQKILGLELVRKEAGAVYLRGDDRDHTLVYVKGDPADHVVGWEVADSSALDAAATALESNKIKARRGTRAECEQRNVADLISLSDPSGNVHELVVRPHHSGRRFFPSRDCGVWSFSHIGLRTTDAQRDERFWTTVMNARVSDRIGAAPLLRIHEVHHTIALFPSPHPGVQHVNHQVHGIDDVMRSYYFLREQGVKIVFGPGRHPTSSAVFLYFEGPDGMVYEYSTGVRLIKAEEEATYRPRQFPFAAESFCMWGSKPDIPEFRSKAQDDGQVKAA